MTVNLIVNRSAPLAEVHLYVRTGYAWEPDRLQGVSHVVEHNLMHGSPARPSREDFSRDRRAMGAWYDAGTTYDYTEYLMIVPARHLRAAARSKWIGLAIRRPAASAPGGLAAVLLTRQLADGVGTDRRGHHRLDLRQARVLPVHGRGGREDDALDPDLLRHVEHVERAEDVHVVAGERVLDGARYGRQRRLVERPSRPGRCGAAWSGQRQGIL